MLINELLKLPVGRYNLTDNNNLYNYHLKITLNDNKSYKERNYRITEKGSLNKKGIFMEEETQINDFFYGNGSTSENVYHVLSAQVCVGGLTVKTNDTSSILMDLKLKDE